MTTTMMQQQQQRQKQHRRSTTSTPALSVAWSFIGDCLERDATDSVTLENAHAEWRSIRPSGSASAQPSATTLASAAATRRTNGDDSNSSNNCGRPRPAEGKRRARKPAAAPSDDYAADTSRTDATTGGAAAVVNTYRTQTYTIQDPDDPAPEYPCDTRSTGSSCCSSNDSRSHYSNEETLLKHNDNSGGLRQHSGSAGSAGRFRNSGKIGQWSQHEVLGRGAHGVVYRGVVTRTGKNIAVKKIHTIGVRTTELKAAENEIRMGRNLRHPNVVHFLGIEQATEHLHIFLEYLDGGSVHARLQKEGRLSEEETADIARKVLQGLSYLHSRGITHRDIKGANVLLSTTGLVKLADFGTSKEITEESATSGLKGTPHWMAPEVIRAEVPLDWLSADIWSVGCTVVEMLTGKTPWPDIPNVMAVIFNISKGFSPPIDVEVSSDARSFVAACCAAEPQQRHTVEMLMVHAFLCRMPPSPPPNGACKPARIGHPTPVAGGEIDGHRRDPYDHVHPPASITCDRSSDCCSGPGLRSRSSSSQQGREPTPCRDEGNDDKRKHSTTAVDIVSVVRGRNDGNSDEKNVVRQHGCQRHSDSRGESPSCLPPNAEGSEQRPPCRAAEVGERSKCRHFNSDAHDSNGDNTATTNTGTVESDVIAKSKSGKKTWRTRKSPLLCSCSGSNGDSRRSHDVYSSCSSSNGVSEHHCCRGSNGDVTVSSTQTASSIPEIWRAPVPSGAAGDDVDAGEVRVGAGVSEASDLGRLLPCRRSKRDTFSCCSNKSKSNNYVHNDTTAAAAAASASDPTLRTATRTRWSPISQSPCCEGEAARLADAAAASRGPTGGERTREKSPRERRFHEKGQLQHSYSAKRASAAGCSRPWDGGRVISSAEGLRGGTVVARGRGDETMVPARVNSCHDFYPGDGTEGAVGQNTAMTSTSAGEVGTPSLSKANGVRGELLLGSPIAVSPVASLRRHSSPSSGANFDFGPSMTSGPLRGIPRRQGTGYNSTFSVVRAAREQLEQGFAVQEWPDNPITGEYTKLERRWELKGPKIGRGTNREVARWRSGLTTQARCMRTKSAGVLGASPKLPPLDHDSAVGSEAKAGELGVEAGAGGLSRFGSSPTTRIAAPGPALSDVESSAGSVSAGAGTGGDDGAIVGAVAATTISASRPQPVRPESPLLFPGTTLRLIKEGRGSSGGGGGDPPISGAPGAGGRGEEGGRGFGMIKHLTANCGVGRTNKPNITDRLPPEDGEHVTTHAPTVPAAIAPSAAAGAATDVTSSAISSAVAYSIADPALPRHRTSSIGSPPEIRPSHRASRHGYQLLRPIKESERSVSLGTLTVRRAAGLRDGVAAAVRADHKTNIDLAMGIGVAERSAGSSLGAGGERNGDSDSCLFSGSSNTVFFSSGGSLSPLVPARVRR